jgi:hypothetical protein
MLEAIVAEAKLTDPTAASYLVGTLLLRQRAIGRAFLDAVTALDDFAITPERLCMTDLGVRYGFARRGIVEWLSGDEVLATQPTDDTGRICIHTPASDDYRVLRVRTRRADAARPAMEVHIKGGPNARILGVIRVAR